MWVSGNLQVCLSLWYVVLLVFQHPKIKKGSAMSGDSGTKYNRSSLLGLYIQGHVPIQPNSVLGIGTTQGADHHALEHCPQRGCGDAPGGSGVVDLQLHGAAQGCYHLVDVGLYIGRRP